jgi:parallel beta-helix repeat protein
MARNAFGGSVSDYVVSLYPLGSSKLAAFTAATLTFYDAETGGNQVTDLALNADGTSPVSSIAVPATGDVPTFYGPDGVTQLWVSANGSTSRVKMVSLEAAAAAVTGAQAAASEAAGHATDAAASATAAQDAAASVPATTDAAVAPLIPAASGSQVSEALSAAYARGLSVMAHGAKGDGVTDDAAAFTAAMSACATLGLDLFVPAGTYVLGSTVVAKSVTVRGDRGAVITATTNLAAAFGCGAGDSNLSNFTVEGIEFRGNVIDEGVFPRRGRNVTGPGLQTGIAVQGDRDNSGTYPHIENITVRDCRFVGTQGLPMFLQGVSGHVQIEGNYISNCMDTGVTFAESVAFIGNYVEKSADNGVSISRECFRVNVSDNTFVDSCYYGVWVSGYIGGTVSTWGPDTFTVSGNVIQNSGHGGIALRDAPRYGSVVGNTIDGSTFGPTDEQDSAYGVGISITGYPSAPLGAPTRQAEQIAIVGNTIRECSRAGVGLRGSRIVLIAENLFIDIGEATDATGTAIAATSTASNCGVFSSSGTNDTDRVMVANNLFTDTRGTPVMNYAITATISGSTNYVGQGNRAFNLRQAFSEDAKLANGAFLRGSDSGGTYRKLIGVTASDNVRTVLAKTAGQWEGYSADEATLLWRITSSGRADFTAGGVTTKYTSGAAQPGYTVNGQVQVWHDTGTGNDYLMVDVNGVIKKIALT